MLYVLILVAIIIGILMPVQAAINSELSRFISNPFLGAFISFFSGALALGLLVLIKGFPGEEIRRLSAISPHLLLGGVLGALFVGSTIFFIPRIGATNMIVSFVVGQLIMSLVIDHYGLFSVPVQTIGLSRILGVFLLFAGLILVIKKSA